MRARRLLPPALAATLVASATLALGGSADAAGTSVLPSLTGTTSTAKRTVMFVGNNWEGTATIVDAGSRKALKTINIIPDQQQEMTDLLLNPAQLALFLAIRVAVGEGHDQFVDDMFTTRDGKYLAVARPSFADVVWIDLARAVAGRADSIVAEQAMDGFRTDHMGVSPDGRRLLVSDSTERQVLEFSMVDETLPDGTKVTMGQRLRSFESGDTPHESNYSKDGSLIYHASIGRVYTPGDYGYVGPVNAETVHDTVKADRWLEVVRNSDFQVLQRWDMGKELEEAGYPEFSSAVRPVALSPDERFLYAQVSFHHGFVEYDLQAEDPTGGGDYTLGGIPEPATGKVTRIAYLPVSPEAQQLTREQYVLDSAHHGIAMNDAGTKLCVAGTMSDYAAIVQRSSFDYKVFDGAARFLAGREYSKPYWSTTGPGNTCWVSMSGSDLVTVIDYGTEQVVAEVPVGDHPQRVREGVILRSIL